MLIVLLMLSRVGACCGTSEVAYYELFTGVPGSRVLAGLHDCRRGSRSRPAWMVLCDHGWVARSPPWWRKVRLPRTARAAQAPRNSSSTTPATTSALPRISPHSGSSFSSQREAI